MAELVDALVLETSRHIACVGSNPITCIFVYKTNIGKKYDN